LNIKGPLKLLPVFLAGPATDLRRLLLLELEFFFFILLFLHHLLLLVLRVLDNFFEPDLLFLVELVLGVLFEEVVLLVELFEVLVADLEDLGGLVGAGLFLVDRSDRLLREFGLDAVFREVGRVVFEVGGQI
jgi:hypothetical protein